MNQSHLNQIGGVSLDTWAEYTNSPRSCQCPSCQQLRAFYQPPDQMAGAAAYARLNVAASYRSEPREMTAADLGIGQAVNSAPYSFWLGREAA